jgi:hypothetical protein
MTLEYMVRENLLIDTAMCRLTIARLHIVTYYGRAFGVEEAFIGIASRLSLLDSTWALCRLRSMERKCCAW